MKKWIALVMALAMMGMLLAGCSDASPETIAAITLAEVNGQKVTKGEGLMLYDYMSYQMAMSYMQAGQQVDVTGSSFVSTVKTTILNMLVEGVVLEQKLDELGLGFTDEDRAKIIEDAQSEYQMMQEWYGAYYGLDTESAKGMVDSMGYTTQALEYMVYRNEMEGRLMPQVAGEIIVTDEEVQAALETLAAEAEQRYAQTPAQYVTDVLNGNTVYYTPEGFRNVQNLVIQFSEEAQARLTENDNAYYEVLMAQATDSAKLSDETAELTDEERAELEAKMEGYEQQLDTLEANYETLMDAAYGEIQAKADEVLALAQAPDADFVALMTEHSTDTASAERAQTGYPVAAGVTNYEQAFTDAAMALENAGDISGLVKTAYGYHILRYAEDIPAGPVELSAVEAGVRAQLHQDKQYELYNAEVTQWMNKAKIKTYLDRF